MIVNAEILEFPDDGDQAVGLVIESPGAIPDDFGVGCRDHDPEAPHPASFFRRRYWSRPQNFSNIIRSEMNWRGARIIARWIS